MSSPVPRPGTHAARILAELGRRPNGASDSELAHALVVRHEIVNSNCRLLKAQGLITREKRHGVYINQTQSPEREPDAVFEISGSITNPAAGLGGSSSASQASAKVPGKDEARQDDLDVQAFDQPSFWEGNVQTTTAFFLEREGWTIVRTANTATRETGKDIEAIRGDVRLWVTVKGAPLARPSAQARLWFADAMFDMARYREEDAFVSLAVALPEIERYLLWKKRTAWFQRAVPFDFLWVGEQGEVRYDPARPSIV